MTGPVGIVMPLGHMGGGAERALLDLATAEVGDQFRFAFFEPGDLVDAIARADRRVLVKPAGRIRSVHRAWQGGREIGKWFHSERVSAVLVWMASGIVPGAIAARTARAPLSWYQHGIPATPTAIDRLATLVPQTTTLACSGLAARHQRAIWPHRRVEVMHPPVDLRRIREQMPPSRAEARRALDLPDDAFVLLMLSRFERWKRPDILIRSVAELPDDVHACLLGSAHPRDPEFADEVVQLPVDLGIADRVRLPGWRDDIPTWIAASDVLVSASAGEPFGISMVEALAAGVPVIGTYGGGAEEIVRPGIDGLLVPSDDVDALVDAVSTVRSMVWDQDDAKARAETFSNNHAARRLRSILRNSARC
ncbi:MAG: glycosyltransferase [Acidimicrobiia bacterium]|nr:glycosyltransferase [Acidimicrobiia bacterium]